MEVEVGGKTLTFETGAIARQANGSVLVRCGDTVIFTAATASAKPAAADFFPLRVDYQENFSSAGKTPGGFIKRQKPTQKEILGCRLIDRPIRPMFEDGYFNEVQLLSYVWSYDSTVSPEPLAICAASAALSISDIPLIKAVAAVKVAMIDGSFVINPSIEEIEQSELDLTIAGTEDAVLMIEGYCDFLTEEQVIEAIETGHKAISKICHAIETWKQKIGKEKKRDTILSLPEELLEEIKTLASDELNQAFRIESKTEREEKLAEIKQKVIAAFCPQGAEAKYEEAFVLRAFKQLSSHILRKMIVQENKRSDGRKIDEVRPIDIQHGFLPRTHGSVVFTRGETQSVAVCTLGGETMAQRFEDLEGDSSEKFYLHYSFPPFSVGETGRVGAPGRREVGHGKLAERALQAILPDMESFPYVIRLESNITESNGSSSMASVCGGCLSMMDAGVPIQRPVSGIAMGLVLEKEGYTILTDILGVEDSLGDMDFKITGDKEGITAFQMDIKVEGITIEIMRSALTQAKKGRVHILEKMLDAMPAHKEISKHAPRIESFAIPASKIGEVIGPGGKMIRAIIEETGVEININDDGIVSITSTDLVGMEAAKKWIQGITAEAEVGKTYEGVIKSVVAFGVFVEILPGKQGLCHISEFDTVRINNMDEVAKEGDKVKVKVIDVNERGQIKLSRKALLVS